MKKLFFIDPMSINSLAYYDYNLLNNICGYDITFIGNKQYNGSSFKNVTFNPLFSYSSKKNPIIKLLSYIRSLISIWCLILKSRPDIVHIQWIRVWILDYILLSFIRMRGCNVVYTAHNLLPHDTGEKYYKQYKRYYKRVNKIIVHTQSSKERLSEKFGISLNKIDVIPHGILSFPISEKEVNDCYQKIIQDFNLSGKFVITSLGIQCPYKGTDILVDLWSSEERFCKNDDLILLLIGKNKGIDYSKIECCKNVIIQDRFLDDTEFQAFIKASSLVVLPYREISQSGVLFSALARRKPILVSDAGGLQDPLRIANVGWCMGEANRDNLYNYLKKLINDMETYREVANDSVSFEKIEHYYSWQSIGRQTTQLYNSL